MQDRVQPLVMAGGQSRRFGKGHKGLHPWHGVPMMDHVLGAARLLLPQARPWVSVARVGASPKLDERLSEEGVLFVEDEPPMEGPGAGLLAGARFAVAGGVSWLLVLACDMPGLRLGLLSAMMEQALASGPGVTALIPAPPDPQGQPRLEPLHALYRPQALIEVLEQAADRRSFRLQRILSDLVGARFLPEAQLEALSPGWRASLLSANTPEDLERLDDLLLQEP